MKLLFWDIETSPLVAHVWGLRDQNVGLNQIVEQPRMLGFAAAWEGKAPRWYSEWDEGGRLGMLKAAHSLLDEAEVVVSYNGASFDSKWVNAEFVHEGFTPPSPYQELDLYRVARRNFRLPSYKLQHVSTHLGLEGKLDTGGHQLWVDCLNGDPRAQAKMARYAKQDVALLPALLEKLRSWLPATVNFALHLGVESLACQKCGKSEFLRPKGTAYTASRAYPQHLCCPDKGGCGGWTRDTRSIGGTKGAGSAR